MRPRPSYRHGLEIEERFGYVQGTVAGELVFVAGQVARGADGVPSRAGLAGQFRHVLANADRVLHGLGTDRAGTVFVQTHVTVPLRDHLPVLAPLHRDAFARARPAGALVQVDALNDPRHLVETFLYAVRGRPQLEVVMPGDNRIAGLDELLGTSPVRCVGDACFVSAQLPLDADGALVGRGDVVAQFRQVVRNVALALDAAGGALDDVVSTQAFLTEPLAAEAFEAFCDVHRGAFGDANRPAGTMVYVPGLPVEGAVVQMSAIAWKQR